MGCVLIPAKLPRKETTIQKHSLPGTLLNIYYNTIGNTKKALQWIVPFD